MENHLVVIRYWFGTDPDDARVAKEHAALWWSKDQRIDDEIRRKFKPLVLAAGSNALNDWKATVYGKLALILLTDQFPRNIFRGKPEAFRFDDIALDVSLQGLAAGEDKLLRPIHRAFFYLPLEHSENLEHQHRCVKLFQELFHEVPDHQKPIFEGFLEYALRHYAIIERFGRFPHRNAILGRESTPQEVRFLQQPGSSF